MMKKILPILLLFFIYHQKDLLAQMDYNQNVVFTTGLNVPNQICFDSIGNLFVANHSYNSYNGPYTNTIAKIDLSGNKSIFLGGYSLPSGIAIDKQQNIYFTQNNTTTDIIKVTSSGIASTFASLQHMPGPITLFDTNDNSSFKIYTVSHWGSQGLIETDFDGNQSLLNPGYFLGCEISNDGQYLYLISGPDNNLVLKYDISGLTSENWVTSIHDYNVWASTTGPDNKPYFIGRSLLNAEKRAVFRINGFNDVNEIINNIPSENELNDLAFNKSGNKYDLYISEVVNGDRLNPDANRIIIFSNVLPEMNSPEAAGMISGPPSICIGTTTVEYSILPIANATGYVWSLPAGAVIISGENTPRISVDFSQSVSGNISVYGTNDFGNGEPSPTFIVTIHPLPANLGEATGTIPNLLDSLVAYYPFNGNANDESGYFNNASEIYGGVSFAPGKFGQAAKFAGYDNPGHIKVNNSPSLQFASEASFAVWLRLDDSIGMDGNGAYSMNGVHSIIAKDHDRHGYFESIYFNHNDRFRTFAGYDFDGLVNDSQEINEYSIGDWIHIAYVYTDSSSSLYINGLIDSTSNAVANFNISNQLDLYFGKFSDYWYPFNGALDEVRIYNRALSAEEVACLYSGDCSSLKLSASLPDDKLCKVGATSLTLFNAQPGVNYQLFKDADPYGNIQTGNSDTLNFYINGLPETALFTVVATDTTTGCSITLDSTFIVEVNDISAIAIANMHSAFIPAMVEVSAQSAGASTYEWLLDGVKFADSPEAQIVIDSTGTHTLVLLVSSGPPDYCTDADTLYLTTTEQTEVILRIPVFIHSKRRWHQRLF
ncbi:MAG: hypothetical protein IPH20_19570 [Bacteroidales bacterium]|nr:hypothetical protein [Bacteroidales bacterium]